jgi:PAS domain S-box-containing protein
VLKVANPDAQRCYENALEARERARLADLLMLSHEPMFAWKLDGAIEFWNAGAEQLYGFSPNEAVGHISHHLLRTKFPIEFTELHSQLRNERRWSGELSHICKNGHKVLVDSRMQLLGDDTVLEVNRDVTVIKQIEATLREHQQRLNWLASIVASSEDAIVSKDLDGTITSWNRGAERLFGYTAEEAIGQPITFVIPQDRQDAERTILTRIRRGERIEHFETVRRHKNGNLISVSLSVSPVRNAEGKVAGASKIARDITAQKRNLEQIATLAREAEHRSKNLLANVQAAIKLSQSNTSEGLKQVIEGRIQALANVHSLFVQTRWIGADLSTIATQELAPYSTNTCTRVRLDGPPVLLAPDAAQAVAVTLHELTTNAAKYGALSAANGRVDLKWSHEADGGLHLLWKETDGPKVEEPTRKGFGGRVIEQMIAGRSGKVRFDWRVDGLVCEITLKA